MTTIIRRRDGEIVSIERMREGETVELLYDSPKARVFDSVMFADSGKELSGFYTIEHSLLTHPDVVFAKSTDKPSPWKLWNPQNLKLPRANFVGCPEPSPPEPMDIIDIARNSFRVDLTGMGRRVMLSLFVGEIFKSGEDE